MKQQSNSGSTSGLIPSQSRLTLDASPSGSVKVKMCLAVDNRNKALKGRKQVKFTLTPTIFSSF